MNPISIARASGISRSCSPNSDHPASLSRDASLPRPSSLLLLPLSPLAGSSIQRSERQLKSLPVGIPSPSSDPSAIRYLVIQWKLRAISFRTLIRTFLSTSTSRSSSSSKNSFSFRPLPPVFQILLRSLCSLPRGHSPQKMFNFHPTTAQFYPPARKQTHTRTSIRSQIATNTLKPHICAHEPALSTHQLVLYT